MQVPPHHQQTSEPVGDSATENSKLVDSDWSFKKTELLARNKPIKKGPEQMLRAFETVESID